MSQCAVFFSAEKNKILVHAHIQRLLGILQTLFPCDFSSPRFDVRNGIFVILCSAMWCAPSSLMSSFGHAAQYQAASPLSLFCLSFLACKLYSVCHFSVLTRNIEEICANCLQHDAVLSVSTVFGTLIAKKL